MWLPIRFTVEIREFLEGFDTVSSRDASRVMTDDRMTFVQRTAHLLLLWSGGGHV